jgi:hypothetical protein
MAKKGGKTKETAIVIQEEAPSEGEIVEVYNPTDPRQALFLKLYYDNTSPTWGNAKQSAISAGFDYDYSCQITYRKPKWWLDFVSQQDIASLIEQHVHEVMSIPVVQQAMGAFGPLEKTEIIKEEAGVYKTGPKKGKTKYKNVKIKTPIMVANLQVAKVKTEVMKLAAPAHNPEMYNRNKAGSGNKFIFNMMGDREKYT